MSDTNDMRRDFEAFVADRYGFDVSDFAREADSDTYLFFTLEDEWDIWQAATEHATAMERERCAVVCENRVKGDMSEYDDEARDCAEAIRKGGDT